MAQDLQQTVQHFLDDPTPSHREAVVVAAVPLVRSLIGRLSIPDHPLASREDLENSGLLGLLQALDTYDPERGTQFVTHAYRRIRGALVDYLRSIDALSRGQRRRLAEAQHATDALRQMLGTEPEDQDVADFMDVPLADYHALMSNAQHRFALSLHKSVGEENDQIVLDVLPDEDADAAFDEIDQASVQAYLEKLIETLPERERTILALYYMENLTLREIGSFFSLTEARISQILGKTLLTLRGRLNQIRVSTS